MQSYPCYNAMDLEIILLSERNQTQRDTSCVIPFSEMSRTGKPIETESSLVAARGSRE